MLKIAKIVIFAHFVSIYLKSRRATQILSTVSCSKKIFGIWHFEEKKDFIEQRYYQIYLYICYTLRYNIEISRKFNSLSKSIHFFSAFALFFLRFLSYFHVSILARSHRIPRSSAYPMLCVTHVPTLDSLNWIEKRGYGKDTSAVVHHADRYSCRRASRKLLYTGNTSFISRSISVATTQ